MTRVKNSKILFLAVSAMISLVLSSHEGFSGSYMTNVKSGTYIPTEPLGAHNLKTLIIPSSNNDYAFIQSIDRETSVVIGNFKGDKKLITLIKDENSDGKVDLVLHWYPALNNFTRENEPDKYCTAGHFRKMKEEIIQGKYNTDNPFADTLTLMDDVMKDTGNISRSKNGFRVVSMNSDKPAEERVVIYFSSNGINGNDLIFEHNFINLGQNKVKPLVKWIVYCRDSKDAYVKELVGRLYSKVEGVFGK